MAEDKNKLEELSAKLDRLLDMHNAVSDEIDSLRVEIIRLKVDQKKDSEHVVDSEPQTAADPTQEGQVEDGIQDMDDAEIDSSSTADEAAKKVVDITDEPTRAQDKEEEDYFESRKKRTIGRKPPVSRSEESDLDIPKKKFDIEKLIGENLINKIGILVLIIGVAIGGKYSIENDLISPLGRIILGYVVGIVLLGLGMWLKNKYLNFSAVLVSGAMTIFYFITFFAFSFYELIGQEVTFGLMVIFTIFTVLAALNYDKEIIAHLGLVGAVSIPFLLSNDSGNVLFLLTYIALINFGIAFISLKKNWKVLFYSSFVITWFVYFSWLIFGYEKAEHFAIAFGFLTLFFILFYVIFIAYKFLNLKKYGIGDVIVLLLNALIFFATGYVLLEGHEIGGQILGVFAVGNALIHFIAATIINKRKLADRNIFYLVVGLVLICLTLAIPIQLDGYWVTIMWSLEAVVLFWIGRSRQVVFYEYISFALMLIAGFSLLQDWEYGYFTISRVRIYLKDLANIEMPMFFNSLFLTSLIASASMGAIYWIHNNAGWRSTSSLNKGLMKILDYAIPVVLMLVVFFSIRNELMHFFTQRYAESAINPTNSSDSFYSHIFNDNIRHKTNIWLLNYSMIFLGLLSILVYRKAKSMQASWAMIGVNILVILAFLAGGQLELSELRENYLNQYQAEYFIIDNSFIWMRYVSLLLLAFLIGGTYLNLKKSNKNYKIYAIAETLFYLVVLWVTTSELIQWLDFTERSDTYGLALSIFWGIFSVIIIAFGIWKKKKHLRILGIAIFAVTLIKLFFYDLSHLSTIAKTIVMISLGALLLLTSFLYNKYTIEDEEGT